MKLFIASELDQYINKAVDNSLTPSTVKFLNLRTPEIIAIIYLKFKQRHETLASGLGEEDV